MKTIIFFSLCLFILSCSKTNEQLELSYPFEDGIIWEYDMYRYENGDTTYIGYALARNNGVIDHEGKSNVLQQERFLYLQSLAGANPPYSFRFSYIFQQDDALELFSRNYFDLYDRLFDTTILDTLTQQERNGPDFQSFSEIQPRWRPWLKGGENPDLPSSVLPPQRVYLEFMYRSDSLKGFTDVSMVNRLDNVEILPLDTLSVFTYRMVTTTFFDMNLQRNGIDIPTFRVGFDTRYWITQRKGIIRIDRQPFELYIPQIPSRFPIVSVPGVVWELQSITGLSL